MDISQYININLLLFIRYIKFAITKNTDIWWIVCEYLFNLYIHPMLLKEIIPIAFENQVLVNRNGVTDIFCQRSGKCLHFRLCFKIISLNKIKDMKGEERKVCILLVLYLVKWASSQVIEIQYLFSYKGSVLFVSN